MKVYIVTKAEPFGEEVYVGVKANRKAAEKLIREMFPHAKPVRTGVSNVTNCFECVTRSEHFTRDRTQLMFIHEEEV